MQFTNKPNYKVASHSGKEYWISRSIAVVVAPLFRCHNTWQVPLGLRSLKLEKHPRKWGLVSGFLDWNETFEECVFREFWEELGIDLDAYISIPFQPDYVWSEPVEAENQTVSLRFAPKIIVSQLPELKPQCDEVVAAQWFNIDNLPRELAFNHRGLINWSKNINGV